MMLIDGIFLVQVDLEELVMSVALEAPVSSPGSRPWRRRRAETLRGERTNVRPHYSIRDFATVRVRAGRWII